MNPCSRRFLRVLLTWVLLAQPSLASVVGAEHAFAEHGGTGLDGAQVHLDAGRHPILAAGARSTDRASQAPDTAFSQTVAEEHGAFHHGCDHSCHACAHPLGLPASPLPIGFSGIRESVSWYRATLRSQHRSRPERPPRTIA